MELYNSTQLNTFLEVAASARHRGIETQLTGWGWAQIQTGLQL